MKALPWFLVLGLAAGSAFIVLLGSNLAAAAPPAVKHPNLFLNREEIQEARAKIRREPWAAGTEVYVGDGPITDSPPYGRIEGNPEGTLPMLVARRIGAAATFAAVHEPYDTHPAIRAIRRIQETEEAVGIAIEGDAFCDRVLVAFQPDKEHSLHSTDGEAFTFRDHAYVRIAGKQAMVCGTVTAFRIRAAGLEGTSVAVNGKEQPVRRDGEFLVLGDITGKSGVREVAQPAAQDRLEQRASVHYFFLPEEAHLKAGAEKEVAMHLRSVGQGKAQGRLRLAPPPGITVQPEGVDLAGMGQDEERTVPVRIRAAADAANALHTVRIEPQDGASAATGMLLVSVGVVITDDARVPLAAQSVVRAPGYTMRIDHLSGVGYGLLDGDGHRRHGHVRSGNACYGIPAVAQEGRWAFKFEEPCRFVWPGANSVIAVSGSGIEQVRMRYTFQEEQVVLALVPPTHPTREYTVWLGEFDALGEPRHNGAEGETAGKPTDKKSVGAVTADWFFFPHPVHRQGLLLVPPPKTLLQTGRTAVNFPLRAGQEVVLRFATAEELPEADKTANAKQADVRGVPITGRLFHCSRWRWRRARPSGGSISPPGCRWGLSGQPRTSSLTLPPGGDIVLLFMGGASGTLGEGPRGLGRTVAPVAQQERAAVS